MKTENAAGGRRSVQGLEGIVCADSTLHQAAHGVKLSDEALKYTAKGWPVFPCGTDKKPLVPGGFKSASTDIKQVRAWWTKYPTASIGCPMGALRGAWVLDVDLPDGPLESTDVV